VFPELSSAYSQLLSVLLPISLNVVLNTFEVVSFTLALMRKFPCWVVSLIGVIMVMFGLVLSMVRILIAFTVGSVYA